jgi:hypothetical protein
LLVTANSASSATTTSERAFLPNPQGPLNRTTTDLAIKSVMLLMTSPLGVDVEDAAARLMVSKTRAESLLRLAVRAGVARADLVDDDDAMRDSAGRFVARSTRRRFCIEPKCVLDVFAANKRLLLDLEEVMRGSGATELRLLAKEQVADETFWRWASMARTAL